MVFCSPVLSHAHRSLHLAKAVDAMDYLGGKEGTASENMLLQYSALHGIVSSRGSMKTDDSVDIAIVNIGHFKYLV